MAHIPFGYQVVNAEAQINEAEASKLRTLFDEFISCGSMRAAANKVGLDKTHSIIGNYIGNRVYLGTDYYPQIIDEATFNRANELRKADAIKLGRVGKRKIEVAKPEASRFVMPKIKVKYKNPYYQAAYAYGLIKEELDE